MDNIKAAIVRVGQRVRALDRLRDQKFKQSTLIPANPPSSSATEITDNKHNEFKLTPEIRHRTTPILKNYERKRYQEFLEPLNMTNLKMFNENSRTYDKMLSMKNWHLKKSTNNLVVYQTFLDNQISFGKMLDLLVEQTPEDLMGERSEFTHLSILQAYEDYTKGLKYDTPRYYYQQVPKPDPQMSTSQFEEYIYFLTHSKILYKNSSSSNGVVSDILLYTHKLDNESFKTKRTVKTYNNLIKYYGHDKNQSVFARTLLMVMEKDGISPNIETINELLKTVAITGHIRSNSNIFQLVIKYLKLAKLHKLPVNLLTWKRVYDCINNLYTKEMFLNKMSLINLPITKDISYKIIDDYSKHITDEQELIKFIEMDINFKNWRRDDKIVNKLTKFRLVHSENPLSLLRSIPENNYDIKYIYEGIINNHYLPEEEKLNLLLQKYHPQHPGIFRVLINQLAKASYDIKGINTVMNRLVYDFGTFSGSTDNDHLLRHLTGSYNIIISRLKYFDLTVEPKENSIAPLDPTKTFHIPKRISNNMNYGRINSITKTKLLRSDTTIEQRLQQEGIIP